MTQFSVLQDQLADALRSIKPGLDGVGKQAADEYTHVRLDVQESPAPGGKGSVILTLNGATATVAALVHIPGVTCAHYKTLLELTDLLMPDRIDFSDEGAGERELNEYSQPDRYGHCRNMGMKTYAHQTALVLKSGMTTARLVSKLTGDQLAPPPATSAQIAAFTVTPADKRAIAEVLKRAGREIPIRVTTLEGQIVFEATDTYNYAAAQLPAGVLTPNARRWYDARALKTWLQSVKPTAKRAVDCAWYESGFTASGALVPCVPSDDRQWSADVRAGFTARLWSGSLPAADLGKLAFRKSQINRIGVTIDRESLAFVLKDDEGHETDRTITAYPETSASGGGFIALTHDTLTAIASYCKSLGKTATVNAYLIRQRNGGAAIAIRNGHFGLICMGTTVDASASA